MDFNKKTVWVLTDGSQGMVSQVMGLAQHFSKKIYSINTKLIFPWSVLQPGFLPIFSWIFVNNINNIRKPDIVISCGRKSVYLSLYLKKIYSNKIITIHIQNPKINFSKFDFIVAPNHDRIIGNNVINSLGAIHKFNSEIINKEKKIMQIKNKNLVSVIIGGKNRHYKFSKDDIYDLISKIKKLKNNSKNFTFLIISSRRTSNEIKVILSDKLKKIAIVWNEKEKNPYLFSLKYSKFYIITSDSTSMISECAFTGRPILVYHLPFRRESKRMENFHNEFEKLKITRKFLNNTKLEERKYKRFDEAKRISGILKERIIKGHNES